MSGVAIITVNFRTGALVAKSLHALASERAHLPGSMVVYVIDNDSRDESIALISDLVNREDWADWVHLRLNPSNNGFSAGSNIALKEILRNDLAVDYVYFLNPDAVILPGAIRVLTDFLDGRKDISIVGSCLQEPDGCVSGSAFRFPTPIGEFLRGAQIGILDRLLHRWVVAPLPKDHPHKTDWVSGASFMVRRNVFEKIGLLDEGYFLYFDEVDFMKSAADANLEVWHNPHAKVVHAAGSATKIKNACAQEGRLPPYWYNSWRRYFVKHHGRLGAVLAGLCWLAGHVTCSLKRLTGAGKAHSGGASPSEFVHRALIPAIVSGLDQD